MDMQLSVEKIKQQRDLRAWTKSHLAEVANISLRTIQRIEKTGIASQESAQAICSALEIKVEYLLAEPFQTPHETNSRSKYLQPLLVPAIVCLGMAVSFRFDANEVEWLWSGEPIIGVAFGCVSIAMFILMFYKHRKSDR